LIASNLFSILPQFICQKEISLIVGSNILYSPEGRLSMEEVIDFLVRFILNGLKRRGLDPKGHRKLSKTAPKSMPEGR